MMPETDCFVDMLEPETLRRYIDYVVSKYPNVSGIDFYEMGHLEPEQLTHLLHVLDSVLQNYSGIKSVGFYKETDRTEAGNFQNHHVGNPSSAGYTIQQIESFTHIGANGGVIYLPTKEKEFIPQVSGELMYKKNLLLIRAGVQLPLIDMEYNLVPYLKLTYLLD